MNFEWDAEKAQKNLEKHGVRFEIAEAVFIDPNHITVIDDRFDYGEERLVTLGQTYDGVLMVVTTKRDEERIIRIISARKANKRERIAYPPVSGKLSAALLFSIFQVGGIGH